jgi:hypothetical protein
MKTFPHSETLRNLGNGLVLRRSTPADSAALSEFNAQIHGGPEKPETRVGVWTADLLRGDHPTMGADDFTIVEDTTTGKIISSMNLIPQTWRYEGIPFGVGRPELVGTDPAFRNRGLVRYQFDVIHEWSRARGHLLQAITGIPYYYRQFGYAMALNLGGGKQGYSNNLPKLAEGASEPFLIRPATEADLPFMHAIYEAGMKRYPLSAEWTPEIWRYELLGKSKENVNRHEMRIIQTPEGESVGWLFHQAELWGRMMAAGGYELKPGISWAEVTPSVVRYLVQVGPQYAVGNDQTCDSYGLWFGEDHPSYEVAAHYLPSTRPPYAWYIRIPDLPAFIRRIAPALERRLTSSNWVGWNGDLHIGFYRSGLHLKFVDGRLEIAEPWQPTPQDDGIAGFPDLTFFEILLGRRSFAELRYAYPDCWGKDELYDLFDTLFPRQSTDLFGIS